MILIYDLKKNKIIKGNSQIDGKIILNNTSVSIDKIMNEKNLSDVLRESSGFYSIIKVLDDKILCAVDCIRSKPIFYTISEDFFILSSDVEDIFSYIEKVELTHSKNIFLQCGYVTQEKTLYDKVYQIQAGEIISFSTNNYEIKKYDYFLFNHESKNNNSRDEFINDLDSTFQNCIERAIDFADGRKIVLPLSGGYDSRLIALYLKKNKYANVLCYSYGRKDNPQADYSRKIAEILGFEWVFIEYTKENWIENWYSDVALEYQHLSFNGVSLPHIQDWLAIKIMTDKNILDDRCVIMPGHAGDFVAGSHMPIISGSKKLIMKNLYDYIIDKNYLNKKLTISRKILYEDFNYYFNSSTEDVISVQNMQDNYEEWLWRERQAKYIVNSVKVYEQFNLEWWLPFWDKAFVDLWNTASTNKRFKRELYIYFVEQQFFDFTGLKIGDAGKKHNIFLYTKSIVKNLIPSKVLEKVVLKKQLNFSGHYLLFDVITGNYKQYIKDHRTHNIIGVYSAMFMNNLWGKDEENI